MNRPTKIDRGTNQPEENKHAGSTRRGEVPLRGNRGAMKNDRVTRSHITPRMGARGVRTRGSCDKRGERGASGIGKCEVSRKTPKIIVTLYTGRVK